MPVESMEMAGDSDFESDSDGGMQLDMSDSLTGIPTRQADFFDDDDINGVQPMEDMDFATNLVEGWSVDANVSNEAAGRRQTNRSQNPHDVIYNRTVPDTEPLTPFEEQARLRSDFSDEKYAALAVLKSRELLMTYALANNETIPQTRRRFMAKYLEPDDPEKAEEIYDPRIYIAPDGKGSEGSLIRGRVRQYIGDINDHGWHQPAHLREKKWIPGSRSASRSGSGTISPRISGGGIAFGSRSGSGSGSGSPLRGGGDDDEL
ncbi:hypothetical protein N7457_005353 [Penicillium paradoxum]|uniref:uncharacterized protein n=1 Tax=Penicillium paradoxum TaxID=176176 RepID=UPI002548EAFC|nr:uncharacterized protein N7457_005353 [Penicillium paradoxum]KAJ5780193.1 hypothetical protein N7457_005353 [Penicillium paradoxum]